MTPSTVKPDFPPLPLPDGVRENYIHCSSSGLTTHIIEAGEHGRPLILLVHGYPELAFSWRKVILPLASNGYYVVAFDQRGYGRTLGWPNVSFHDTVMSDFSLTKVATDVVALTYALGYREAHIVGHDFGAVTASLGALVRPDIFRSLILISHPFKAPPELPFDVLHSSQESSASSVDIQADLAKLPQPRSHYKWYNSTPEAATHWNNPPQGLRSFLRGYIHVKSAAWTDNKPYPLKSWTAEEVARLPFYYVLPLGKTMPDTIADMMTSEDASATTSWLTDTDLAIYEQEWSRTGFQGSLNFYRAVTDPTKKNDLDLFAGKKISCPAIFISGKQDWGNYQEPGVLERMEQSCTNFKGIRLIDGAGHWPQQEKPEQVVEEILKFLKVG